MAKTLNSVIFGHCIKEALFFTKSHMILTGFLETKNYGIQK